MVPGRVVVTGAGGLVGRSIAEKLTADGLPTIGVVRGGAALLPFETAQLDLSRQSILEVEGAPPVAVVHCAASVPATSDGTSDSDSGQATRRVDEGVIRACGTLGCRLVYVSSCILYDPFSRDVKTEDAPIRAATPYAQAKLDGEVQAADLAGTVIMRLPSPVGQRMRRSTVLARFVAAALGGQQLGVWGSGEREQDFIDVGDIASFVSHVLGSDATGTFNVASGRPVTMRRLAERVVTVIGGGTIVVGDRPDPLDGTTARYDPSRAQDRLGWMVAVDLETMIRRVAASLIAA